MSHKKVRRLCEGALMIAMAEILSFMPLYRMPWDGAIDLAMLPVFLFCARWGFGPGILISAAHAVLQALFQGGIAIGWESIVGDFLIAYTVMGFAGLCKNFFLGTLVGSTARFLVHYVVGATIWAELMPETFFRMTMTSPWIYSALYNGVYMVADCVMILVIGYLLTKTSAKKYLQPYEA